MIRIRIEQIEAFQRERDRVFIQWLAGMLRAGGLADDLDEATLCDRAAAGLARARRYGLDGGSAVAAFVKAMFRVSPTFDLHPAVQPLLRGAEGPAEIAVLTAAGRVPDEQWQAWRERAEGWEAVGE